MYTSELLTSPSVISYRNRVTIQKIIDLPRLHGGGWSTGVSPGLQNRVRPVEQLGWVRFPRTPALLNF